MKKILRSAFYWFGMVLILSGCSLFGSPQVMPETFTTMPQDVAESVETLPDGLDFVGNVEYKQSVTLKWKTSGVIGKINVKLGDNVVKGQILAELESGFLSANILSAEKTMIDAQDALIDTINSEVAKVRARQTVASKEKNLKSAKVTQEQLYYPRSTQEERERAYDAYQLALQKFNYAKADYAEISAKFEWGDVARANAYSSYSADYSNMVSTYEKLKYLQGTPSDTDLAVAQSKVELAQKAYDTAVEDYQSYSDTPREVDTMKAELAVISAENVFNRRYIIAPFAGTVTSAHAEIGQYVTSSSVAYKLDDLSEIYIPIAVSEIDINKVTHTQKAIVSLDAETDVTYSGELSWIAAYGESSSGNVAFSAYVKLNNADNKVKAGMTAAVRLILE